MSWRCCYRSDCPRGASSRDVSGLLALLTPNFTPTPNLQLSQDPPEQEGRAGRRGATGEWPFSEASWGGPGVSQVVQERPLREGPWGICVGAGRWGLT